MHRSYGRPWEHISSNDGLRSREENDTQHGAQSRSSSLPPRRRPSPLPKQDVFDHPHQYRPQRWLDDPGLPLSTWGGGIHRCKGQSFAYLVMRTATGLLFKHFRVQLVGGVPDVAWDKGRHPSRTVRLRIRPR